MVKIHLSDGQNVNITGRTIREVLAVINLASKASQLAEVTDGVYINPNQVTAIFVSGQE